MMKISIITATSNSQNFITTNLNSINNQTYKNFEHIIVDNNSQDKTLEIIKNNGKNIKIISEKDNGIYDAFNKGIDLSNGEIISIINSDDYFADEKVLEEVSKVFANYDVDIVYGDLKYVKRENLNKIVRYWKSNSYVSNSFQNGWAPPHPTFFVKKKIYENLGKYKLNLGNSADFELMFRFLEKNNIKSFYLNKLLVIMRTGGVSNNNYFEILKQNITLLDILNIRNNIPKIIKFCLFKLFYRLKQFIQI